jgi:hypothetical protein
VFEIAGLAVEKQISSWVHRLLSRVCKEKNQKPQLCGSAYLRNQTTQHNRTQPNTDSVFPKGLSPAMLQRADFCRGAQVSKDPGHLSPRLHMLKRTPAAPEAEKPTDALNP